MEFILEFLIDIGLLGSDIKHYRRIRKKERKDGIKRPFQKYFLQPSALMVYGMIAVGLIGGSIFMVYQRFFSDPEKTRKEISKMAEKIEGWNTKYGHYPEDLNEIIGKNPLRQNWRKDVWNRPYEYIVTENGKGFLIKSAGADGQFNTDDDIVNGIDNNE